MGKLNLWEQLQETIRHYLFLLVSKLYLWTIGETNLDDYLAKIGEQEIELFYMYLENPTTPKGSLRYHKVRFIEKRREETNAFKTFKAISNLSSDEKNSTKLKDKDND